MNIYGAKNIIVYIHDIYVKFWKELFGAMNFQE